MFRDVHAGPGRIAVVIFCLNLKLECKAKNVFLDGSMTPPRKAMKIS
jgi:hypothetical protein